MSEIRRRALVAAYMLVSGFASTGIAGLIAYPIPGPVALQIWLGLTAVFGLACGLLSDRILDAKGSGDA